MSKVRVLTEQKDNVRHEDVEFDFRDVQTRNPRLQGKTPLYLFTKDMLTIHLKHTKKWWEK